jgi:hypothetical protein
MKHLVCAALVVVGCSKSQDTDWSKKPLKPAEGTAEGFDKDKGLAFTIEVPEGLPRDKRDPGDWSDARVEYDAVPKVFTSVSGPVKDLDDAMHSAALRIKDANFVRKETRPDGFALTDVAADKHRVEATTFKKLDAERVLKCTAVQVMEGELPSFEATKAMLEKICDSIKPK